jgi:hypothetical protein
VEFAIVAVAFFLFLFGIFDMARMLESWITVQHAAREGARYAITGRSDFVVDGTTVCTGRENCIIWSAKHATEGLYQGGDGSTEVSVSYKAWDYNTYSGSGTDGAIGKPCDQIEVEVQYTHHFATPLLQALVPGGIMLKGDQRMTNEPFGSCKAGDGVS